MTTKQVNIRLEENLINDVVPILSNIGLSITDACRIFLNKVIMEDGIPFTLKNKERDYVPNEETVRALMDAENGKNLTRIDSIGDLWKQYDN